MGLVSVLVFFVVAFGLGALAYLPLRRKDPGLLDLAIMPGVGIALFILLSAFFSLVHIPLHWALFAVLGVIGIALLIFVRKDALREIRVDAELLTLVAVILLVGGMFSVYVTGAFSYPYLENDDSWGHASSTSYVAIERTVLEPEGRDLTGFDVGIFQYIDPYPPAYNALMGVFAQMNVGVSWTLKIFNALIISLGYIFFYVFCRKLMGERRMAFFATLVLLATPAYFSHFIWAISIAVPLYFVALYALERVRDDWLFAVPAAIAVGGGMLTSPTHSAYFVLFLGVYALVRVVAERRIPLTTFGAMAGGAALSAAVWWVPMLVRYDSFSRFMAAVGLAGGSLFNRGTGDRVYSLTDFIFARNGNMINAPIGLGLAVFALALFGLILLLMDFRSLVRKDHEWKLLVLGWFALTFYAVNAAELTIKLSPFRTWMLLAIPVAMLGGVGWVWLSERKATQFWIAVIGLFILVIFYNQYAEGINNRLGAGAMSALQPLLAIVAIPLLFAIGWAIPQLGRMMGVRVRQVAAIVFLCVVFLLILTSFIPKHAVNTALWSPGGTWLSEDELRGYLTLGQLEQGTPVFSLTYRHAANIIGLDMYTCMWCSEDIAFREQTGTVDAQTLHAWLVGRGYEFVIVDSDYALINGINATNQLISSMASSGTFQPFSQTGGFVMMRVL